MSSAPAAVLRAFESCGDGTFSCGELGAVLRQLRAVKPGMSDRDIEALLTAIFVEEVGRLHCYEFCDWIFGSRRETSLTCGKVPCEGRSAAFSATFRASDLKQSMSSVVVLSGSYLSDGALGEDYGDEAENASLTTELPLPDSRDESPVLESSRPVEHGSMISAVDVGSQQVLMAALHGADNVEVEMTPRLPCQAGVPLCDEMTPRVPYQADLSFSGEITPRVPPSAGSPVLQARHWASGAWGSARKGSTAAFFSVAQDDNARYRSYMEDGYKVVDALLTRESAEDSWGFFAVFDGHGGREEVDYCESMLHDIVRSEVQHIQSDEHVGRALRTAFEKIDSQLALLGAWSSGCTATVALVHRRGEAATLHVANVGDSRAVMVGDAGSLRLSTDHRASDPYEAERVRREGGVVRNDRVGGQLSVSRSLGDHHLKSRGVSCIPEVRTCSLRGDQALIIASDGLWDALEDCDAGEVLGCCVERAVSAHGGDEKATADYLRDTAARELVEYAKERGSQDNILALVVFF